MTEHCYRESARQAQVWEAICRAESTLRWSGIVACGVIPFATVMAPKLLEIKALDPKSLGARVFLAQRMRVIDPLLVISTLVSAAVSTQIGKLPPSSLYEGIEIPDGEIQSLPRLGGGSVFLVKSEVVNREADRLYSEHSKALAWTERTKRDAKWVGGASSILLFSLSLVLWRIKCIKFSRITQASAAGMALWTVWMGRFMPVRTQKHKTTALAYRRLLSAAVNTDFSDELNLNFCDELLLDKLDEETFDKLKEKALNLKRVRLFTSPSEKVYKQCGEWKQVKWVSHWNKK